MDDRLKIIGHGRIDTITQKLLHVLVLQVPVSEERACGTAKSRNSLQVSATTVTWVHF